LPGVVVEPQARPAVDDHDVQAGDRRLDGQDPRHAGDGGRGLGAAVGRCAAGAERQRSDREQEPSCHTDENREKGTTAGVGTSPGHAYRSSQ
jgi:hypothetical protein